MVAPHVGAWIEMVPSFFVDIAKVSHPTWVRGLKCYRHFAHAQAQQSHPTWVRGLKWGWNALK